MVCLIQLDLIVLRSSVGIVCLPFGSGDLVFVLSYEAKVEEDQDEDSHAHYRYDSSYPNLHLVLMFKGSSGIPDIFETLLGSSGGGVVRDP